VPAGPALSAYVLCATPRSGSTLLCETLAATGVAGRPNSFFRPADILAWADSWAIPHPDGPEAPDFDRAFLAAARREGEAGTGVFGLRLMWDSLAEASRRLNRALGREMDVAEALEAAFGPVLFVHLSREDRVAQAVSRLRAEQSGLWHLAADGSVLEGAAEPRATAYDGARIAQLVRELADAEDGWDRFFRDRDLHPLRLTYEGLAARPAAAVALVLAALGLDPTGAADIGPATSRLPPAEGQAWVERFRRDGG
jgi:LPS sulfotransferase NodH